MAKPKSAFFENVVERVADVYVERLGGLKFDIDKDEYRDMEGDRYGYAVTVSGSRSDSVQGGAERDVVVGGPGADKLAGGGQDDFLYGGAGDDVLTGGEAQDRLEGGAGADKLYGGSADDDLSGGDGGDYLDEGAGHGDLEGGKGRDTLVGGQGPDAFAFDRMSGADVIKDFTAGPGMFDHLVLREGIRFEELRFADSAEGVTISWKDASGAYTNSVKLEGVRQADLAQDDFMFTDQPDLPPSSRPAVTPSPERLPTNNAGPDVGPTTVGPIPATFDSVADLFLQRNDLMLDFGEQRIGVGQWSNDRLVGSSEVDVLIGRAGNDRLSGMAGDDVLQGDAGKDRLEGGAGSDWLDGGQGDDRLDGGDQADVLMGEEGRDRLDAGAGHDMLEGGAGDDELTGGAGADAFIVSPDSGNDVITDFQARGAAQGAFDHLALRDIDPDEVTVTDTKRGVLVSWDTDEGDGSVLLVGLTKADLRQSDFMFFEEPGFVDGISTTGSDFVF